VVSWPFARAVILGIGIPFLALSIGSACLDYAGEELMRVCPTADGGASTSSSSGGSGSGSGSILLPVTKDDCGAASSSGSAGSP
jgi:hypothetical protein